MREGKDWRWLQPDAATTSSVSAYTALIGGYVGMVTGHISPFTDEEMQRRRRQLTPYIEKINDG